MAQAFWGLMAVQTTLLGVARELSRSLATTVILWGSSPSCPSCSLVCPDIPRAPDCVCEDGVRVAAPECSVSFTVVWLALVVGIVIGSVAQQWYSSRSIVVGRQFVPRPAIESAPLRAERSTPSVGSSASSESDIRRQARAQIEFLRLSKA